MKLSQLERMAIKSIILDKDPNYTELYILTHPQSKATEFKSIVCHWKNSAKFQDVLKEERQKLENLIQERITEERKKWIKDLERSEREKNEIASGLIDYSDPRQQQRKLNELVNNAEDTKEALDALKTIMASQKETREALKEGKQIKVYLPMTCKSCLLYQAEEKNQTI